MSELPLASNSIIRTDLTDLDLSSSVSVPTSTRPMSLGETLYLARRALTAVRHIELMSSLSDTKAMLVWPRPIVYLPALTPSAFSSSAWLTYSDGTYISCIMNGAE